MIANAQPPVFRLARLFFPLALALACLSARAADVTVQVVSADPKNLILTVKGKGLTEPLADGTQAVTVGAGDAAIGYVGRTIRGDLAKSEGKWRLDSIWPA